jgi:hypothetical protein
MLGGDIAAVEEVDRGLASGTVLATCLDSWQGEKPNILQTADQHLLRGKLCVTV